MRRGGIDKVSVVSCQRNKAHEVNDNDGHHANIENWRKEQCDQIDRTKAESDSAPE